MDFLDAIGVYGSGDLMLGIPLDDDFRDSPEAFGL
jgi:hypothetical protein